MNIIKNENCNIKTENYTASRQIAQQLGYYSGTLLIAVAGLNLDEVLF
jgi:hypothetical protein